MTLGSLFSGSGGFELAGLKAGITPVWNSEVEPFCIRVTTKRLPFVRHLGNISKIHGGDIEPVDIITFGSPCQDMSIAGKRKGLNAERSGLFYEAVRVIKEMREATGNVYPRYIVWENVLGCLSSNKGEDFRNVLEQICKIKDEAISIIKPDKWENAGLILGEDFSVCWRVLDAQYFGVPQRRKRIFLVGDFAGERAGEILFEQQSVPRDTPPCGCERKSPAGGSQESPGETGSVCLNDQGGIRMDITDGYTCALRAESSHPPSVVFENHSQDTRFRELDNTAPTVSAKYGTGGNNQPFVVETPKILKIRSGCEGGGKGALVQDNKSGTLGCNNDQTLFAPYDVRITSENTKVIRAHVYETDTSRSLDTGGNSPESNQGGVAIVSVQGSMIGRKEKNGPQGSGVDDNVSFTLNTTDRHAVAYGIDRAAYNQGKNAKYDFNVEEDREPTMVARGAGAVAHSINFTMPEEPHYVVRKLTPLECCRLQGFPDFWCDYLETENPTEKELTFWRKAFDEYCELNGRKKKTDSQILKWLKNPYSDGAQYRMWGNGIALPCAEYILKQIVNSVK